MLALLAANAGHFLGREAEADATYTTPGDENTSASSGTILLTESIAGIDFALERYQNSADETCFDMKVGLTDEIVSSADMGMCADPVPGKNEIAFSHGQQIIEMRKQGQLIYKTITDVEGAVGDGISQVAVIWADGATTLVNPANGGFLVIVPVKRVPVSLLGLDGLGNVVTKMRIHTY